MPKRRKKLVKLTKRQRSLAAKKGWETRRKRKRSLVSKKGWETRQKRKRSLAAKKGWKTKQRRQSLGRELEKIRGIADRLEAEKNALEFKLKVERSRNQKKIDMFVERERKREFKRLSQEDPSAIRQSLAEQMDRVWKKDPRKIPQLIEDMYAEMQYLDIDEVFDEYELWDIYSES